MITEAYIGLVQDVTNNSVIISDGETDLEISFTALPVDALALIKQDLYIRGKLAVKALIHDDSPPEISLAKEDWR
jgi:hypothetical protein